MIRIIGTALAVSTLLALAACSPPSEAPVSSAAPSPAESTSASPTPTEAATVPLVTGADVGVLERLESPTTGETWHAPVPIENLGLLAYSDSDIEDDYEYYEVGARGDARIVVAVPPYFEYFSGGHYIYAMFEVDGAGARLITCPSARAGDSCLDWSTDWEEPGQSLDGSTHYDSLTYPERVQPRAGWFLKTARLADTDWAGSLQAFGDANTFPGIALESSEAEFLGHGDRIDIVDLGASTLFEYRRPAVVPGLTDSRFAIETPYGGVIPSESHMSSEWYGIDAVTWNDGMDSFTHPSMWEEGPQVSPVRAAGPACFGPDETIANEFDPSEWVASGTHRLGFDVYLPQEGGNEIAQAVWITMRDTSWGEDIEPALAYPYDSLDAFLDARSVFAWERPDGEWIIAMDGFAGQRVYECA